MRGLAALIFGVLAFIYPSAALYAMVIVFGVYAILDGILALATAFSLRIHKAAFTWLLIEGVVGLGVGLWALFMPGATALALLYLAAAWAVVTGAFELFAGITIRDWWLLAAGVASVILGVLLFARPGAGLLVSVMFVAAYAVVFGIFMIALAFSLRGMLAGHPKMPSTGPTAHPV